jgi:protein SCO1
MTSDVGKTLRIIRWAAITAILLLAGAVAIIVMARPAVSSFSLTDMNGQHFDGSSLNGKPYAVFFGYTHCPDVCPTTMQDMSDTLAAIGEPAKQFQVLFVTIDPVRDTQELLKTYLTAFDPRILGLTGTQAEINVMTQRFGVVVERVGEGESMTFNHTAAVLLFDTAGQFTGTLSPAEAPDIRKKKLERLLAG